MTINHDATLPVEAIMAMGLKRISGLVEQHGITSPEVFSACERWGSILDDVNHPDSTCRWCGQPVAHNHAMNWWYHVDDKGGTKACKTHAGAEATPLQPYELEQAKARIKPKLPLGQPVLGLNSDDDMQKRLNDQERRFQESFKPQGTPIKQRFNGKDF